MTVVDLKHLGELEAAATPGPFKAGYEGGTLIAERGEHGFLVAENCTAGDVAFIAAARNALPALIRELEAARELIEVVRCSYGVINGEFYIREALKAYDALEKKV